MRILWVCNIVLPKIARNIEGMAVPADGGWMSGLLQTMEAEESVTLGICFPMTGSGEIQKGKVDQLSYYGFRQEKLVLEEYSPNLERQFREIMEDFQPDILHIFGTEYVHSLAAVKAFSRPDQTVINIQGLVSVYAGHFMANLPDSVQKGYTLRDLIRRDNLIRQRESFYRRAVFEKEAIRLAGHVIGRTDWDEACTKQIHPNVRYHFCNETLRDSFYEKAWKLSDCEKHSIFVSQGSYPIKGLHFMLEALPIIRESWPDVHLYVAGGDIAHLDGRDTFRLSSYGKYIRKLIYGNGLEELVTFTGFLNEKEMRDRYLRTHVFVSPSSIENSPNSVCEAMILGVPSVCSDVGGVKNLMTHEQEGYIYPMDAPYMLAYYVMKLFASDERACQLSDAARKRALVTHDRETNQSRMLAIYREIAAGGDHEAIKD